MIPYKVDAANFPEFQIVVHKRTGEIWEINEKHIKRVMKGRVLATLILSPQSATEQVFFDDEDEELLKSNLFN